MAKVERRAERLKRRTEERLASRLDRLDRVVLGRIKELEGRFGAEAAMIGDVVATQRTTFPGFERRLAALAADCGNAGAAVAPVAPPNAGDRPLRVGLVTTWGSRDGVAEYSRYLVEATPPGAIEWTILAEEGVATEYPDDERVVRCWRGRRLDDLSQLLAQIERRDLDLVHFQFHDRYFEQAAFARAVEALGRRGSRVWVTFHRTHDIKEDRQVRSLAGIAHVLRRADRLLVLTEADVRRLAAWGVSANVAQSAHGWLWPGDPGPALIRQRLGIECAPVVATYGFLAPRKQTLELIDALAVVRRRFPEAMLLAVTAFAAGRTSRTYYHECLLRIAEHGLHDRAKLLTDFLPLQQSFLALQAADVIVLPYRPQSESSSGAVRVALGSGRPVIATRAQMFDDVVDETLQVDDAMPATLSGAILRILDDRALADELVRRARQRAERDSWQQVAAEYAERARAAIDRGGGGRV